MMEVALQNDLSHSVERRFGRIDLGQHIFTGDILLHHTVNRLHLSDNFFNLLCRFSASIHCLMIFSLSCSKIFYKYVPFSILFTGSKLFLWIGVIPNVRMASMCSAVPYPLFCENP